MLSQLVANGLVAGALYSLLGMSFGILSRAAGFFVFTFGASYMCAAYVAHALAPTTPLVVSVSAGIVAASGLAVALELFCYTPIRRRTGSSLVLMLASIGCYTVLQHLVSAIFGDSTKSIWPGQISAGIEILGAYITRVQMIAVVVSGLAICATAVALRVSSFGQELRAIAADRTRALSVGIDVKAIMAIAAALSGALAGLAGILVGIDRNLVPLMGFQGLLIGIVVAVVGGSSRLRGSVIAGMMIGMTQQLAVWKLPAEWQDLVLYILLIVFLLARPRGATAIRSTQLDG